MNNFINDKQIEYVLFHLNLVFNLTDEIRKKIICVRSDQEVSGFEGNIVFRLSDADQPDYKKSVDGIPVIFPCSDEQNFWQIKNKTLVFHDDLLKSSFYLLSGYQEYVINKRDALGRFSAEDSIQYKLDVLKIPVVNYYFEAIRKGIQTFLGINVEPRLHYRPFAFFLSHDVDRMRLFSINYLVYKIKEIAGLRKSSVSRATLLKQLMQALKVFLIDPNKDPAADFEYLFSVEQKFNLVSTFFFLNNESPEIDSDYNFTDQRLKELLVKISGNKGETGLHGSHYSAVREQSVRLALEQIRNNFPDEINGIRQHRLRYEIPVTTRIHEKMKFTYDASLGYYNHEGFRNSFCLPFRLYDFEEDKMSSVWEIPLNVMDCTLIEYRGLSYEESMESVKVMIAECIKFSGVFSLLWHNGYFDEIRFKGIRRFYESLIGSIVSENPVNLTGSQIVSHISNNLNS